MKNVLLFLLLFFSCGYAFAQIDFSASPLADQPQVSQPTIESRPLVPAAYSLSKGIKGDSGDVYLNLSRLFFKASVGYGFMTPGSYRTSWGERHFTRHPDNTVSAEDVNKESKAIGRGFRIGGGLGYILNDFMHVGLDFEYQCEVEISNHYHGRLDDYNYDSTDQRVWYKGVTLTPYVLFKAVTKPKYFVYARLGVLITLPGKFHSDIHRAMGLTNLFPPRPQDSATSSFFGVHSDDGEKITLAKGVGINFGFGVNFKISDHTRLFGEFMGNFATLRSSSGIEDGGYKQNQVSYSPVYDYSTDPPTFVKYEPVSQSSSSYYHFDRKHRNNYGPGDGPNLQWLTGPPPDYAQIRIESGTIQSFDFNINVVSFNIGFTYRF
jgi:hypothetical protein